MFVKHNEDLEKQNKPHKPTTNKPQTWVLKIVLTLFSALSDSALQWFTVLSKAFRMIYLSMYFETFIFFPIVSSNNFIEYSCLLTEVLFTWNGNAKH